jgi:hypothetical protein
MDILPIRPYPASDSVRGIQPVPERDVERIEDEEETEAARRAEEARRQEEIRRQEELERSEQTDSPPPEEEHRVDTLA